MSLSPAGTPDYHHARQAKKARFPDERFQTFDRDPADGGGGGASAARDLDGARPGTRRGRPRRGADRLRAGRPRPHHRTESQPRPPLERAAAHRADPGTDGRQQRRTARHRSTQPGRHRALFHRPGGGRRTDPTCLEARHRRTVTGPAMAHRPSGDGGDRHLDRERLRPDGGLDHDDSG